MKQGPDLYLEPKWLRYQLSWPAWLGIVLRVGALEALSTRDAIVHLFLDFFLVGAGLPGNTAGSIHPPVTTGHGDEVVLNFLCPAEHVDSPPWSSK